MNPAQHEQIVVKDVNNNNEEENENANDDENQAVNAETDDEADNENLQQNTWTRNWPDNFTYDSMGQTHQQNTTKKKGVMFDDKMIEQIEQCHNLMAVTGMNTVEYNPNLVQMIGQLIAGINGAVTRRGLDIIKFFCATRYAWKRT